MKGILKKSISSALAFFIVMGTLFLGKADIKTYADDSRSVTSPYWGDLNGDGYIVVPYKEDEENPNSVMEIGYITKKNSVMSKIGVKYLEEIDGALSQIDKSVIYEE